MSYNGVNNIKVLFKKLHPETKMPVYKKFGDACCDLFAIEDTPIDVMEIVLVRTGFAMEMPEGFEAQVRPRSGLAVKHGLSIINSPATIDWGYRGEVMVPMINLGREVYTIHKGDRFAQMKFDTFYVGHFLDVGDNSLSTTDRGDGGFGHSGLK